MLAGVEIKSMIINIPVEPKGKQRARTVRTKTGKVISYTPGQTAMTESMIRVYITQKKVYFDKGVPIHLIITFYLARPKSCPKKRTLPVTRPDLDNMAKLVLDACNKFLWADDAQITDLEIYKRYSSMPSIQLQITEASWIGKDPRIKDS